MLTTYNFTYARNFTYLTGIFFSAVHNVYFLSLSQFQAHTQPSSSNNVSCNYHSWLRFEVCGNLLHCRPILSATSAVNLCFVFTHTDPLPVRRQRVCVLMAPACPTPGPRRSFHIWMTKAWRLTKLFKLLIHTIGHVLFVWKNKCNKLYSTLFDEMFAKW